LLPHDFPPWGTVSCRFFRWRKSGLWQKIRDALRGNTRVADGRQPLPSLGILDRTCNQWANTQPTNPV
jgi:putative transposase